MSVPENGAYDDRALLSEGRALARVDATEALRKAGEGCPNGACWCGPRTQNAEHCEALIDGFVCHKPTGHPCHHLFRDVGRRSR